MPHLRRIMRELFDAISSGDPAKQEPIQRRAANALKTVNPHYGYGPVVDIVEARLKVRLPPPVHSTSRQDALFQERTKRWGTERGES